MLWTLGKLPDETQQELKPKIERIIERIASRAIRLGVRSLRGVSSDAATWYRRWAKSWLSGDDRSKDAAMAAARASFGVVAWDASCAAWDASCAAWDAAMAAARDAASDEEWAAASHAAVSDAWDAARDAAFSAASDDGWAAARAACDAAGDAELLLQARDVRREIPTWPGCDKW